MPRKKACTRGLTPRQKEFVRCYVQHFQGSRAAREAGYSEHTASRMAYQLLRTPHVRQELDRRLEEATATAGIDANWVLARYVDLYEKCMQIQEVTDRKGRPTGEFTFDSAGADRALQMIARFTGGFDERHKVTHDAGDTLRGFLDQISGESVAPPREREVFQVERDQGGRVLEHQPQGAMDQEGEEED